MGVKCGIIYPVLPPIRAEEPPLYLKPIFCLCFRSNPLLLLRTYSLLILFFVKPPGLEVVLMTPSSWYIFITDPCKASIFLSPLIAFPFLLFCPTGNHSILFYCSSLCLYVILVKVLQEIRTSRRRQIRR